MKPAGSLTSTSLTFPGGFGSVSCNPLSNVGTVLKKKLVVAAYGCPPACVYVSPLALNVAAEKSWTPNGAGVELTAAASDASSVAAPPPLTLAAFSSVEPSLTAPVSTAASNLIGRRWSPR